MKRKIYLLALLLLLKPLTAEAKEPQPEYIEYIEGLCETYQICPELVESVIFYESSWTTDVVSSSGCVGLMQINEKVHRKRMKALGVTDLKNGYQNILVGVDILSDLFSQYEDTQLVLDAYSGQLHSDEWYASGKMTSYSKKILEYSEELEREHDK